MSEAFPLTEQQLMQPRSYQYTLTHIEPWQHQANSGINLYDAKKKTTFADSQSGRISEWTIQPKIGDKITVVWQNLKQIEFKINGVSVWRRLE